MSQSLKTPFIGFCALTGGTLAGIVAHKTFKWGAGGTIALFVVGAALGGGIALVSVAD